MGAREEFWEALRRLIERQEKTDEQLKKTDEQLKKTDEQLKKTDEQLKRTDEQLRKMDEQLKKTDEQLKRTDERIKKLTERIEGISDGYARFVEGIMSPSAYKVFSDMGFKIRRVLHREKIYRDAQVYAEIDTRLVAEFNGNQYIIVGEAKTRCQAEHVEQFIDKITKLRQLPDFKPYRIIGFIAAINYGKAADRFAQRNGIYTFYVTGDIMELKLPPCFTPREF